MTILNNGQKEVVMNLDEAQKLVDDVWLESKPKSKAERLADVLGSLIEEVRVLRDRD